MSERIELDPWPINVDAVDRWLRNVIDQRTEAVRKPTPDSESKVAHCNAAINALLEQRLELTETGDDPVG